MEPQAETALPDEALAAILGRLPPRSLEACRRVCRAWRAVVDARGLLLPPVLPRAVRGIFVNYVDYRRPRFFARPSPARPGIDGNLDFLPGYATSFRPILDHCNGLLLYGGARELYVVNPATRRWERLPPRADGSGYLAYLVFDPAVSPHFEVFLVPRVPEKPKPVDLTWLWLLSSPGDTAGVEVTEDECRDEEPTQSPAAQTAEEGFFATRSAPSSSQVGDEPEDPYGSMEWPPSPCTFHVFSSSTGHWEERPFVREGDAVGTIEEVRLDSVRPVDWGPRWRYGVYWQGALHVHCRGAFIMRLSFNKW